LHHVVYDLVQQIFNARLSRGYSAELAVDLFESARIVERICEGSRANLEHLAKSKVRLGYAGHIIMISEELIKFVDENCPIELFTPTITAQLESPQWTEFVETTLQETRNRNSIVLGGVQPPPKSILLRGGLYGSGGSDFGGSIFSSIDLNSTIATSSENASEDDNSAEIGDIDDLPDRINSDFSRSSDEDDEEDDDDEDEDEEMEDLGFTGGADEDEEFDHTGEDTGGADWSVAGDEPEVGFSSYVV